MKYGSAVCRRVCLIFSRRERTLPRAYGIMLFFPIFTKNKKKKKEGEKSRENEVVHGLSKETTKVACFEAKTESILLCCVPHTTATHGPTRLQGG